MSKRDDKVEVQLQLIRDKLDVHNCHCTLSALHIDYLDCPALSSDGRDAGTITASPGSAASNTLTHGNASPAKRRYPWHVWKQRRARNFPRPHVLRCRQQK